MSEHGKVHCRYRFDVANRAQKVSNEETKSFRVRVLIDPRDDRLRPDMSANVDIETRVSPDDALRAPSQAVVQRPRKDVPEAALARATWLAEKAKADPGSSPRSEDSVDCVFVASCRIVTAPRRPASSTAATAIEGFPAGK